MGSQEAAARLKILVAVEKFKRDLSIAGLDEVQIQDALDEAVYRSGPNPITKVEQSLVQSLSEVADEKIIRGSRHGTKKL
jgi:hypothetical protein